MKIFVTRRAGFIGSNFIRHVLSLSRGEEVVNYDKLTYAGNLANLAEVAESPCYSFVRGYICDGRRDRRSDGGFAIRSYILPPNRTPIAALRACSHHRGSGRLHALTFGLS